MVFFNFPALLADSGLNTIWHKYRRDSLLAPCRPGASTPLIRHRIYKKVHLAPRNGYQGGHPIIFSVTVFFSDAYQTSFFLSAAVWLSSASAPCACPSCLYLPSRASFEVKPLQLVIEIGNVLPLLTYLKSGKLDLKNFLSSLPFHL